MPGLADMHVHVWDENDLDSHLDVAEHHALLANAGYSALQAIEDSERGWLCTMGTGP